MHIRKMFTVVEDAHSEADIAADEPLRKVAVVAVVKNPFCHAYEVDLTPLIEASPAIGKAIAERARDALAPYAPMTYGKGVVIGIDGEQEHGVAMVTTPFGNAVRDAAGGGQAWIPSFTKRASAGAAIDVPLAHKDALYVRECYDGMTVHLNDAPLPDEIAVICCYANRPRLNARVGGLQVDDVKGEDGLV